VRQVLILPNVLITIVVVSTLAFGTVEPWSLAIVGILTAVAFAVFTLHRDSLTELFCKRFFVLGAILLAYGLFQLLPLPMKLLEAVSPALPALLSIPPGPADLLVSDKNPGLAGQLPAFHAISIYPFATEMELSRLVIYLMIFLMAAFGPRTHEEIYSVLRVLAIFGFTLALFAVVQKATWNGKLYWIRELSYNRGNPLGPFVNRNHFAGWMCMVAPLSFGLGLMSRSTSRSLRYIFFAVVMAITIFFSLSRGGIISFLLSTVVLTVIVVWGASSRRGVIPVLSFVVALLGYLIYLGVSPIVQRFAQSGVSSAERLLVWSASITAFRNFPVFGTGLGTFQHIFPMYKPDGIETFYQHAHNDYIEILLELGISGAFLGLVFLGLAGKHILYVRWRGRKRYLKAAFVASLVSLTAFSLFDFNLHIPSNAILLSFILGLAVAMSRLEQEADSRKLALRERPA
jgi:O-antigen ligase